MIDGRQAVDRSPTHLLHRASQCAEALFDSRMAGSLTPRQLAILIAVAENEGLHQTAVVQRTGIDRSTMAEIIPRLVRKGLLQRRRSRADSRAKVLHLTEEGRKLLDAAEPVARNVEALLLVALPKSRRAPFMASLQAIIGHLEGAAAAR